MGGCQSAFKPKCRAWDHPREFQDPGGRDGGLSHIKKEPVLSLHVGECG